MNLEEAKLTIGPQCSKGHGPKKAVFAKERKDGWRWRCSECSRQSNTTRRNDNPEAAREYARTWRSTRRKLDTEFAEQEREKCRRANRKLRLEAIAAYGKKCVCCDEDTEMFLCLDHIDNNGAEDRKNRGVGAGTEFYRQLRKEGWPPGFQILCQNCNWGKYRNNGTCPHEDIHG